MTEPNLRLLQERLNVFLQRAESREGELKNGSGDGTSGGMEARIARLESDMEHVKKAVSDINGDVKAIRVSIGDLKTDFGRFDERLKHMPGKGFIFAVAAGMLSAVGVIVTLAVRFIPAAG